MTANVPFESPERIQERLAEFEEKFKYRYTEKDELYNLAQSRPSWWYKVPVMRPWPPRRPPQRDHRRRRGHRAWDRPPYRSSHHYDERDRWPHRGTHRSRSPGHSPSYREHSPRSHYHRSPSPHQYSHPHNLSPHRYHDQGSSLQGCSPQHSLWPPEESPWQSEKPHSDPFCDNVMERGEAIHREVSEQERDPEKGEPEERKNETDREKPKPPLFEDFGLSTSDEKSVPTESDVLDILNIASGGSNTVTANNLRKVQKQAVKKREVKREETTASKGLHESATRSLKVPSLHKPSSLLISHGNTENVPTSLFSHGERKEKGDGHNKPKKKKRRKIVIDEDENEEEGTAFSSAEELQAIGGFTTKAPESVTALPTTAHEVTTKIVSLPPALQSDEEDGTDHIDVVGETEKDSSLVLSLDRNLYSGWRDPQSELASPQSTATFTAVQTDPNSTKLIIRSRTSSRSDSPIPAVSDVHGNSGYGEGKSKKKSSKKKKKSKQSLHKGKHAQTQPLKLKITMKPD